VTTIASQNPAGTITRRRGRTIAPAVIPLRRIVSVELRKSFDTRAGFWLLTSIGITSLLATGLVILFAPTDQFAFSTFTLAIGYPISVILPMIAVLSVTAEWSQRSGLTTFTLVPHRGRVMLAKAIAVVSIAMLSMPVAFLVGALGNIVGSAITDAPTVWDQGLVDLLYLLLGNTLLVMVGFMLGVLIRASAGALVAYFSYAFIAPTLLTLLAVNQAWFRDWQPWVDPHYSQDALFQGGFTAEQWTQLAVTSVVWLVVPLAVGVLGLLRSEVK
jgi:hypothetical protein